jgi:hypothetical protein
MSASLPRKALISISSYYGVIYPDGTKANDDRARARLGGRRSARHRERVWRADIYSGVLSRRPWARRSW